MKEEQLPSFNHRHTDNNKKTRLVFRLLNSPAVYVILLLLSYALGYLSAPSSGSPPQPLPSPEILKILCIDDFRGWPGFRDRFGYVNMVNSDVLLLYQFMQNVIHKNATGSVLPLPFSSGSALEKLCEWGVFGDLIEIDAGHDFNSAWADINRAYQILRPGGIVFGHDYFTAADNRGVRRAVNLFAQMNGLKIHTDGQHWVIDSA
ncbi:hypothetical protein D5086_005127 [Populus alba]|uniref:Uncharacterized protein n=1 Tax=Populus alba TaxID=43335 RepID=A0ACC4CTX8_POPAL